MQQPQPEHYEMKVGPPPDLPPPGYGPPPPQYGGPPGEAPPPGYGPAYGPPPQQYPPAGPPQPNVVVVGPQPVVMVRDADQVQDNTVISIISIFFCCILGIIATVKAFNSKSELQRGDIGAAKDSANTARKLAIAAIVTGCIITFIVIFVNFILPLILVGVFGT